MRPFPVAVCSWRSWVQEKAKTRHSCYAAQDISTMETLLVCLCGNIKTVLIVANPGLRLFLMGNLQWRCSDSISIWDYWTLSFTGLYLSVDNQPLVSWLAIKKKKTWKYDIYGANTHAGVHPHTHTHTCTCLSTVMWWYCNLAGCTLVWIWDVFFAFLLFGREHEA